jgi:aminoglycoside phosphotransferase (APT) family kinase protein
MTPESALEFINAAKSTQFSVAGQFSGGEDQGAFRVSTPDGQTAVLKISKNPQWKKQVERAKAATDHLRPLGYPVPTYMYIDATDAGTFWLEDELPGQPVEQPSPGQIDALLGLVELQKNQTISQVQGQDWGWYATSVVFRGESGLVRQMMQYGTETSALAAQIEALALGLDTKVLPNTDLVHGDFGIQQVLIEGETISAVLDWDQVGYGDRTLDLVGLWYSLMDHTEARDQVMKHMLEVSDKDAVKIFASYRMLASVSEEFSKTGGDITGASQRASTALGLLSKL